MAKTPPKTPAARQVELTVRGLECVSTLPTIAARALSGLWRLPGSAAAVAAIIESDAALTARIFSLAYDEALTFTGEKPSVQQILDKLPGPVVRDAVLSVKVFKASDVEPDPNKAAVLPRKRLVLHSLAVACCAKDIAELVLPADSAALAYSAGLLHDIGKLALQDVMPKSFERIAAEAKSQKASIRSIEQKHFGLDHTLLGKRLAEKWHLPGEIVFAVWLHHSSVEAISESMPRTRIAQIVRLADLIVRGCGIGDSGSYDACDGTISTITQSLSLSSEQINQIRQTLPQQVERGSGILGLDAPDAAAEYIDAVHETAARLAEQSSKLSAENRRLGVTSAHFDFVTEFLSGIEAKTSGVDAARHLALRWQKFYQTGPVCVYLADASQDEPFEAVIVDETGQIEPVILNGPGEPGTAAIPAELQNKFAVLEACEHVGWLFEQLNVDFDSGKTKIAPLLARGRAVGAIVFELRCPLEAGRQYSRFAAAAAVGGAVIALCCAYEQQQHLAEEFVELLGGLGQAQQSLAQARLLTALAEMAAGAGHELNSPLAVISGRAQLLEEAQTDPEKKKMLGQIRKRSEQISEIVSDLMSFAKPAQPVPEKTAVRALLDAAVDQAARKQKLERLDVRIDGLKDVFVDSRQMTSVIANLLVNAVESYKGGQGPIKITGGYETSGDYVKLQVIDFGCGMDAETIEKAAQPFFSFKPAGRKRGMGLAHAQRLVQLNKGSLSITSQPGEGTTVTILLPCK